MFDILENDVTSHRDRYPDCTIIIQGDFNARTASLPDFIENDDYTYLPIDDEFNYTSDNMAGRTSQDQVVNKRGTELLNFCRKTGMRICNGRTLEDFGIGKITCFANDGQSVVDYVLCCANNLHLFRSFHVCDEIESSHLPISYSLCVGNTVQPKCKQQQQLLPKTRYVWASNKSPIYQQQWQDIPETYTNDFCELGETGNVALMYDTFQSTLLTCVADFRKRQPRMPPTTRQGWFDEECQRARACARSKLCAFHATNCIADRLTYIAAWKLYKDMCQSKQALSITNTAEKLGQSLADRDFKSLWYVVRGRKVFVKNNICASDWTEYYQKLFSGLHMSPDEADFYEYVSDFVNSITDVLIDSTVDMDNLDKDSSCQEISDAISQMHSGKAPGFSGVPIEFFKYAPRCICSRGFFHSALGRWWQ